MRLEWSKKTKERRQKSRATFAKLFLLGRTWIVREVDRSALVYQLRRNLVRVSSTKKNPYPAHAIVIIAAVIPLIPM